MGNMKEKEGLGDMGEGDIEEEIERRKYQSRQYGKGET